MCRLTLTRKGKGLLGRIEADLVAEYRAVLQGIPAASRRPVLDAIEGLRVAFEARRATREDSAS